MEPLKASAAALLELAAARQIEVTPSSPLRAVPGGENGVPLPTPAPALEESLRIAAQPTALVRLAITVPGRAEVATIGALVRGPHAVHFTIDRGAIELGLPIALAELAGSIAREATYAGPLAAQELYLWPSTLKLLSFLWQDAQDPAQPVGRADALARLAGAGSSEQVGKVLSDLVRVGIAAEDGGALRVAPALQPWLALVWSGHALQVEYLPLPAGVPFVDSIEGTGDRLFFVGPPGRRVLDVRITGEAMARHAGGAPAEDALVRLSTPPTELLRAALALVLHAEPPAA